MKTHAGWGFWHVLLQCLLQIIDRSESTLLALTYSSNSHLHKGMQPSVQFKLTVFKSTQNESKQYFRTERKEITPQSMF